MLLVRETATPLDAVERLAGLQAQLARPPFIGLWSRIENFQRDDLAQELRNRAIVRATLMRGTLHLMSAREYVKLRAAVQPALTQAMQSALRGRIDGLDIDRLVGATRDYLDDGPRTFEELRAHLVTLYPDGDERAMGHAVRMQLPLVQAPTEAAWSYPGTAQFADAESWLGEPLEADQSPHNLVMRYLGAFGPATVNDAQTWSGLKGLRSVVDELRPKLSQFQDEAGKELFDLPEAPRPSEETHAPVRFLPEYDNLVLAHADRRRIVADEHRPLISKTNLQVLPTFLVDGDAAGTWKIERKRATATLAIEPFEALSREARNELADEADRLVRFVESDAATFQVTFAR